MNLVPVLKWLFPVANIKSRREWKRPTYFLPRGILVMIQKKNVPFENEAEEKTFSLSLILDLIVKVRKRVSCSELHYTT